MKTEVGIAAGLWLRVLCNRKLNKLYRETVEFMWKLCTILGMCCLSKDAQKTLTYMANCIPYLSFLCLNKRLKRAESCVFGTQVLTRHKGASGKCLTFRQRESEVLREWTFGLKNCMNRESILLSTVCGVV